MNDLQKFRKTIDHLDRELIDTLAKRQHVVREVGEYKKKRGILPLDKSRWEEVIASRKAYAKKQELPEDLIEDIFNSIHAYSLVLEKSHPELVSGSTSDSGSSPE